MVLKLDGLTTVQGPYLDLPKAKTLLEPYKRAEDPAAAQNEPEISEDDETIEIGVL